MQQLVTTLRDQIRAIEESFEEAVHNTVGRVSGAGGFAADEIRAVGGQLVDRTREVVETVAQQAEAAGTAISDAENQAAGAIAQASDDALGWSEALGNEFERRT